MMNVAHQIIVPAPEVELVSVSPVIGTGSLSALDAIILAVPHARLTATPSAVFATLSPGGVFVDVNLRSMSAPCQPVWGIGAF
jgi:hypothetical protein